MSNNEILQELKVIHEKVDRLLTIVERLSTTNVPKPKVKNLEVKSKPISLTDAEIQQQQLKFKELYEQWDSGNEMEVQEELERLDVDELRRLADINNLNVTSKMSKQKVLHLIGARFREKRQLHKGIVSKNRDNI